MVWFGKAWHGCARQRKAGLARIGKALYGRAWQCEAGKVRLGMARTGWSGEWRGETAHGMAGVATRGAFQAAPGDARQGMVF